MKLSRRDFVYTGCAIASAFLTPHFLDVARAGINNPGSAGGGGGGGGNVSSRATLNVQTDSSVFLNFAKGWFPTSGTALTGANTNANGYPTTALTVSTGISLKQNYYGQWVWKFTGGTASMQFIGQDAIVYTGGTFCGLGTNTGVVTGNFSISAATNPRVVFKFGTLVTAISGGSGSLVTITTVSLNFGSGVGTGTRVSFNQGCSTNLINGPNADGSWTVTNVSGTQFTLNGSTGVVGPTITTGGVVGVNTEAVFGVSNPSLAWVASGTYTNIGNLVICTAANETDITNGLIWDPAFVADTQSLMGTSISKSPGWLRFMDFSGVQGNWDQDFNQRILITQQCWTNNQLPRPNYFVSAGLTNTGAGAVGAFTFSDIFTCAPPAASPGSGAPVDGEIIQGAALSVAAGSTPALSMTGRTGTWPIIDTGASWFINPIAGATGAGVVCTLTFSASWLNGGTPYVFTYTTVSGDTNRDTFGINFAAALVADATLKTAKFVISYAGNPFYVLEIICPTALADATNGMVRIIYSGSAGLILGTLPYSGNSGGATNNRMSTGLNTLMFSKLMGAFIRVGAAPAYCPPFEAITELCNRTGNNCWFTWPIYTQQSFISAVSTFMGQAQASGGLASNLKFGGEFGNEMWNFGAAPWGRAQCYGIALGLFTGTYGGNFGPYSWTALNTIYNSSSSKSAWISAGRSASNHYTLLMTQVDDVIIGGNWDLTTAKGQFLTTAIASYANFGGVGFTSTSTSFNTSGSYPADISDAFGFAPYWGSAWEGGTASGGPNPLAGTVAQNAILLQASFDFANGNTAAAFSSLTSQFNNGTKPGGRTGEYALGADYLPRFTSLEATVAQFDPARIGRGQAKLAITHYEASPQWQLAQNVNSGVNSANCLAASIASGDISVLATALGNLGWTTAQLIPYTVSGTGNLTEVATNLLVMGQGWKYDTDVNANPTGLNSYANMITTYYYQVLQSISGNNREARGAQYGVWGNQWGFYYSTWQIGAAAAYKNRDAFANWNA